MSHCRLHSSQPMAQTIVFRICATSTWEDDTSYRHPHDALIPASSSVICAHSSTDTHPKGRNRGITYRLVAET